MIFLNSILHKMKKLMFMLLAILFSWFTLWAVPNYYIANYQVQSDLDKIEKALIEIDSSKTIWSQVGQQVFLDFYNWLDAANSYLPQEYEFQVIYNQCLILSKDLSQQYSATGFQNFIENCQRPFESILGKIKAQYTVVASATANPSSWPAPLVVTFDARNSIDPSDQTIPSDNYYRYYRDVDGNDQAIWQWPVLNHKFEEAGNYIVHLTVRSSNHWAKWVFDWSDKVSVNVSPKSAIISVYANAQKLDKYTRTKFWTTEASQWIIFDGSSTIAMWGRQIMSHTWSVQWGSINFTKTAAGSPDLIKIPIINNWEYSVSLQVVDNESNEISESYNIVVSDPIAIINQEPEFGNTSNTFTFDSNWSYSVTSAIKLYTWEIFDDEWNKINTIQEKRIQQQFKEPWNYTIKLSVEDDLWNTNIETRKVFVESTEPLPQFSITSKQWLLNPSEFVLDASLSSDLDVSNQLDSLTYERNFSDTNNTKILKTQNANEVITVVFDRVGTHTVTLVVKDDYGKISEISKDIKVNSILRPELFVSKKATIWWDEISFSSTVNADVYSYEWDFWDGEVRIIQADTIIHKYDKVGNYVVTLTVFGENDTTNSVSETVFIWDKNEPIPAYDIKNNYSEIIEPKDTCTEIVNWITYEYPAHPVDRYNNFIIDTSKSVNTKWFTNDLKYYFQPRNAEIYAKNGFNYSFDELWCNFVDFTLEDTQIWVNKQTRIWFKVYNQLPTLNNVLIFFPQYWNEMGIGFQENNVKDIFNTQHDPLLVKVQATNPIDWDGFISYYKRYYYNKEDPSRKLETKITPGDITEAYFSLPKVAWEFMFGVTLYDSDDWVISSEEIIWNWPVVFFPPDTKRPDIPIVTARVDKNNVNVWEEVTFDVISKTLSDSKDFETERTIQYDFDWDGVWDHITKSDRVTHTYLKPNEYWYTPRVAVIYRWYKWIWNADNIIVKEWLKPWLLYETDWKYVLFRDVSIGNIDETNVCLDILQCARWNTELSIQDPEEYFSHIYDDFWKYFVSINVKDKFANEVQNRFQIELLDQKTEFQQDNISFVSIPKSTLTKDWFDIIVWNNLSNSILYYIWYEWDGECYVDLNILDDKEKDFNCNTEYLNKYIPNFVWTQWKIYYTYSGTLQSKPINVSFLDYDVEISEQQKKTSTEISNIINELDATVPANQDLIALLVNLQQNLLDEKATQANIIALQNFLDTNVEYVLEPWMEERLDSIVISLADSTVISWLWWSEYMQAKSEILAITPYNLRSDVEALFFDLENSDKYTGDELSQKEYQKSILQEIINTYTAAIAVDPEKQTDNQITQDDMDYIIMPNICVIADYYQIVTETCASWNNNIKIVDSGDINAEEVWMSSFLKRTLIVLWIVLAIFITLIVIFGIKAKLNKQEEDDED